MMNLRTDVQMTSITIFVFFTIQNKQISYGVSILLRYGAPLAGLRRAQELHHNFAVWVRIQEKHNAIFQLYDSLAEEWERSGEL